MPSIVRPGFCTQWAAGSVEDLEAVAPYKQLVAITRELGPNNWIAEVLPRAEQHTWLDLWRACEGLYRRSGVELATAVTALEHRARERVLVANFAEPPG